MAERQSRVSPSEIDRTLMELAKLTIEVVPVEDEAVLALARQHNLTIYDACYLRLAVQRGTSLATLDKDLARAAKAVGVGLFPPEVRPSA